MKKVIALSDKLSIPYEVWDNEKIKSMLPIADTHQFSPVKSINDGGFGQHNNKYLVMKIVEVYENPEVLKGNQRTWCKYIQT